MPKEITLSFFNHFPLCGACADAWDVMFDRIRSAVSVLELVSNCPHGGCDGEIFDYIDFATGWPVGVDVSPRTGRPSCYAFKRGGDGGWKGHFDPPCDNDDRLYHRREAGIGEHDPDAAWRKIFPKLYKLLEAKSGNGGKKPPEADSAVGWDDEEDTVAEAEEATETVTVPADAPDDDDEWA